MLSHLKERILKNIDIVLVNPTIADNIGLVARVLKNTAFTNLVLVNPNLIEKAYAVAKRAKDILEKAKVYSSLEEALSASQFIFGTTRRVRAYKFIYNFENIKPLILSLALQKRISILFGREDFGLAKEELELCHSVFYLPAHPQFPSYNLSFAVGIVCYELFYTLESLYSLSNLELAPKGEIESFFGYLEKELSLYVKKERLGATLLSLKRIFLRTHLTNHEVALLKSLLLKRKKV